MSPRRPSKTAGELLDELEQDPEYQERQRRMAAEREERRRRYDEAAAGLRSDLKDAGFEVDTIAELRQKGAGRRSAIPILMEWFPKVTYKPVRQDIVAALGSTWARPAAAKPLVEAWQAIASGQDQGDDVRWEIGDALERVADESVLDDVLSIAQDERHGDQRGLVVAALGNMRQARDRVVPPLLDLLNDPKVAGYAVMGLGKLKASEALPRLENLLKHDEPWIRKEAKKAITKIQKQITTRPR